MNNGVWGPSVQIVAPAIWDYEAQPKERLDCCNLCGAYWTFSPLVTDRYGFRVRTVRCGNCGLHFIMERMTREAYARFYETGAYRRLVSAFRGRDVMATIEHEQEEYAQELYAILASWTDDWGHASLLDIGGSTGVVAKHLATHLGMTGTVIEPAGSEADAAMVRGLEVIPATLEGFKPLVPADRTWDLITLCQTADHLLDLMGALKKIKGLLAPDGLFWSDIVDFDVTREVKIDHPFNLTERTYRMFLSKAGFKLLQVNYAPDGKHIGFLCR